MLVCKISNKMQTFHTSTCRPGAHRWVVGTLLGDPRLDDLAACLQPSRPRWSGDSWDSSKPWLKQTSEQYTKTLYSDPWSNSALCPFSHL